MLTHDVTVLRISLAMSTHRRLLVFVLLTVRILTLG